MNYLRYLNPTSNNELVLRPKSSKQISAHEDAKWVGEPGAREIWRSRVVVFTGRQLSIT